MRTQLRTTDNTVNTIQTQVTDIQASMVRLEATVTRLTKLYEQDNHQYADGDSIGDNDEVAPEVNHGRGRGFANCGHGFHPVGIPRLRQGGPHEDDVYGKPKFTILEFLGKYVEEYLTRV
jgi:hypothetical protein